MGMMTKFGQKNFDVLIKMPLGEELTKMFEDKGFQYVVAKEKRVPTVDDLFSHISKVLSDPILESLGRKFIETRGQTNVIKPESFANQDARKCVDKLLYVPIVHTLS